MMRKISRVLVVALLMSLFATFAAFGEGMLANSFDKGQQNYCYKKEDGNILISEWKQVWDNWYYFGEDGRSLQNTWAEIDGKWYYFDQWSIMLADTTTPDGYQVGSDGAWITE